MDPKQLVELLRSINLRALTPQQVREGAAAIATAVDESTLSPGYKLAIRVALAAGAEAAIPSPPPSVPHE